MNKGFGRAKGELVSWQNSDDIFNRDCFAAAAAAHAAHPEAAVLYGQVPCIDADSRLIRENRAREFRLEDGIPWFDLANQCLFFDRMIFDAGLFLDESFHHCMDAEFYWRLIIGGYRFQYVPEMSGSFRVHVAAKTAKQQNVNQSDALRVFENILGWIALPNNTRRIAIERLQAFASAAFDAGNPLVFDAALKLFDEHIATSPQSASSLGFRARRVARHFGAVGRHLMKLRRTSATK